MLATQNPVDLDYKALSNTGTWFLGKLQTERDKARVLDGLEGRRRAPGHGSSSIRRCLRLRSRVFLMHNVHEKEPVTYETRWTLSYLRGPLTRDELRRAIGAPAPAAAAAATPAAAPAAAAQDKPVLPAGISEYFLPDPGGSTADPYYEPVLYGSALVQYTDARRGVDVSSVVHAVTPITDSAVAVDWEAAEPTAVSPDALAKAPRQRRASACFRRPHETRRAMRRGQTTSSSGSCGRSRCVCSPPPPAS